MWIPSPSNKINLAGCRRLSARLLAQLLAVAVASLLMVAAGATPAAHGQQGRPMAHTWKRIYYGMLDGQERLLFGGGIERAKPTLGDLDGDGDVDLLVGTATGRLILFENKGSTGSSGAPKWRLAAEALRADYSAVDSRPGLARRSIDVGSNAAPVLVDIDSDDDLDLLVGSGAGGLYFFRNVGNRYLPRFQLENPNFLGGHLGRNLVVSVADVNNDGLPDLGVGNAEGDYYLLVNQGSRHTPRFCIETQPVAPDCLTPRHKFGKLDPEDNAAPAWVDWDGDGDLDLMVGKSDGKIAYYRNIGDRQQGIWELAQSRFLILDSGGYAAPVFHDLNGDGRPDLLLAGDSERIAYYINRPGEDGANLWLEERNSLQVTKLGQFQSRLHFASGDLNADGRPELVVGTRGGRLLIYGNVGSKDKIALRSPAAPLLPTPVRAHSAPALGDIDGDGDLDMLVGGRAGRLEMILNTGTARKASWKIVDLFYAQIDVGAMSTPLFHDFDKDGDLDLLVGNSLGHVVVYQNRGTRKRADFRLLNIRFAGVKMSASAAPSLFRHDPKADPLIVVGGRNGGLVPVARDPARAIALSGGYRTARVPWRGLRSRAFSAPHFLDLSGDNRPDLLLGGENGGLALWRYEGTVPAATLAQKPRQPGRNVVQASGRTSLGSQFAALPAEEAGPDVTNIQRNTVSSLDPIFVRADSAIAAIQTGRSSKPAFLDVDGDGLLDLLVGTRDGRLMLYRNPGKDGGKAWRKMTDSFAGYRHGRNAAPAAVDLDGDGDLDLAVGTESGRVFYWENAIGARKPPWIFREEVFRNVNAGKNAVPSFFDLDGDKRPDLLAGSLRGRLRFYRNEGGLPPRFKLIERSYLNLDVGVNSSPGLASLLGPGAPVLLVGSDRGPIQVLVATGFGEGAAGRSGWVPNKYFLEGLKMPPGSHPALADIDKDGDLDLFVGSDRGGILFFRNNALVNGTANLAPIRR